MRISDWSSDVCSSDLTEVIQVAIVGALVLGEPPRPFGWVAIVVCMVGVAWLASNGDLGAILRRAGDPDARLGVIAGGLFGVAAVGIRDASGTLGDAPAFDRDLLTVPAPLALQHVAKRPYLLPGAPIGRPQ